MFWECFLDWTRCCSFMSMLKSPHKIYIFLVAVSFMLCTQRANQGIHLAVVLRIVFYVRGRFFYRFWFQSFVFAIAGLLSNIFNFYKQLHLWVFRNSTSSPQSVSRPNRMNVSNENWRVSTSSLSHVSVIAITNGRLFVFNKPII